MGKVAWKHVEVVWICEAKEWKCMVESLIIVEGKRSRGRSKWIREQQLKVDLFDLHRTRGLEPINPRVTSVDLHIILDKFHYFSKSYGIKWVIHQVLCASLQSNILTLRDLPYRSHIWSIFNKIRVKSGCTLNRGAQKPLREHHLWDCRQLMEHKIHN